MDLELVLRRAVELGASDIHLKVERPPIVRCDGSLGELEGEPQLTERDLELALEQVCSETPKRLQTFLETGELDSAYAPEGLPRFRVNGFRQRGSISIAFRVIPREVPDFGDLSLPAGVRRLAEEHRQALANLAAQLSRESEAAQRNAEQLEQRIRELEAERAGLQELVAAERERFEHTLDELGGGIGGHANELAKLERELEALIAR